ncbi:MAG: hypothetical protein JWR19_564 [Pedosphaera sp.]|nr:hypothetical protein [Pedosphaera sp.]
MRRVFSSLLAGAVLSWLLYIAAYEGQGGVTFLVGLYTLPVRLLSSVVTKDRDMGEYVFFTLLTCVNALIVYSVVSIIAAVKRHKKS